MQHLSTYIYTYIKKCEYIQKLKERLGKREREREIGRERERDRETDREAERERDRERERARERESERARERERERAIDSERKRERDRYIFYIYVCIYNYTNRCAYIIFTYKNIACILYHLYIYTHTFT